MGKVHPDIIDAREQFDVENPYLEFLKRRRPGRNRKPQNPYLEVIFWFLIVGSYLYPTAAAKILTIMLLIARACKLYMYDMPGAFHADMKMGLMPLMFCTGVPTDTIWKALNKAFFGVTQGNSIFIWMMMICLLVSFGYSFPYMGLANSVFFASLLFIIWTFMVLCGIYCTLLNDWVYRSGIMVGVCIILIAVTTVLSWGISYILMLAYNREFINSATSTTLTIFFENILLGIIDFYGWRFIPKVAEMRRCGVFD